MSDHAASSRVLRLYRTTSRLPFGEQLFSQLFRFAAPYFRTIPATFESVEPGRATSRMRHVPWVRNHLGGVHAIALCNLAEMTMGALAEATVPGTHRWIPSGMEVAYVARASGTMHAVATLELPDVAQLDDGARVAVPVVVTDDDGTEVFTATITIWVTPRRATAPSASSAPTAGAEHTG